MSKSFFKNERGEPYLMKILYQNPFDKLKTNVVRGYVVEEKPDSLQVRDSSSGNLVLIWKKAVVSIIKKEQKAVEQISSSVKNKYQGAKKQGSFSDNFKYSKWWKKDPNVEEVRDEKSNGN